MNAQDARNYIYSQPAKQQDVATPFWPKLDGKLALRDVPSDVLTQLSTSIKDPMLVSAAMLCKSLILKETGEQLFPDTDREQVAQLGATMLTPIITQMTQFFGFSGNVDMDTLKKISEMSLNGSGGMSSVKEASIVP